MQKLSSFARSILLSNCSARKISLSDYNRSPVFGHVRCEIPSSRDRWAKVLSWSPLNSLRKRLVFIRAEEALPRRLGGPTNAMARIVTGENKSVRGVFALRKEKLL
ncbi:hypothetical protein CEXT_676791 [Caerostris extrusa]|uniref:Uncharacterized protein n=1 Tax=Caerostris extrusa TaxID=172846 RepID=A0AAV4UIE2_CAEEX|nr:hypothetical protein CEXT_676791 [Caerostris extrusa]